jgi:hypothetical protein
VQVYDTFFDYRVAAWDSVETRQARGDTTAPAWPDTTLRADRRMLRRRDAYRMTFRRLDGTRVGVRVPLEVWRQWSVGRRVALRVEEESTPAKFDVLPADSLAAYRRWHRGRDEDNPPGDSIGCSPPPPP